MSASYSPLGLFVKDMNSFKEPFEKMPFNEMERILAARGIEVNPNTVRAKYEEMVDLKNRKGRKALGALMCWRYGLHGH